MKRFFHALTLALTTFVIFYGLVGRSFADVVLKPVGQNAVPLRTKTLSADVVIEAGRFASTRLDITFQNLINDRIEADFIYTVPDGAVVTDFAYYYGDERVVARVVEKERAREIYRHITSRMHDPALVEMVGKNTFRARIFPIMPHADLRVQMRYVQCLPTEGATASYKLPLLSFGDTPLDKIHVSVRLPRQNSNHTQIQNSMGLPVTLAANGDARLNLDTTNFRPSQDVRISLTPRTGTVTDATPPGAALTAARAGGDQGFFALALDSSRRVRNPKIQLVAGRGLAISDLELYAVPGAYLLTGRYHGTGTASVLVTDTTTHKPLPLATVTFTNGADADAVASRLWAAARIAHLSQVDRNRTQVVALSKRWGLPSKFTSWLAIPEAERVRYYREKAEAEMNVLASRLIPFIREGKSDTVAAKALHSEFLRLARSVGEDPAQSLRYRLSDALERQISDAAVIVAKNLVAERRDASARAARARFDRLWKIAGSHPQKEYMWQAMYPYLSKAGNAYAPLVLRNQTDTPEARLARASLERLGKLTGTNISSFINPVLRQREEELAQVIAEEIAKDAATSPREDEARTELERLCRADGEPSRLLIQQRLYGFTNTQARRVAEAIATNTEQTADAQAARAEFDRLCRIGADKPRYFLEQYLREPLNKQAQQLAQEISANRGNSSQAQANRAEIERMQRAIGDPKVDYLSGHLQPYVNQQGARVAEEIANGKEDSPQAQASRVEIARLLGAGSQSSVSIDTVVRQSLGQHYSLLIPRYLSLVEDGKEDGSDGAQLRRGVARIHHYAPQYSSVETWLQWAKTSAATQAFSRMEDWARAKYGKPAYYSYYGWDRQVPSAWGDRSKVLEAPKPEAAQDAIWQKASRLATFAGENRDLLREKALMPWAANTIARLREELVASRGDRAKTADVQRRFLDAVRDPSYGVYADYELRSYGKNTVQGREAFARDRIAKVLADPSVDEVEFLLDTKAGRLDRADHNLRLARRYEEDRRLQVRQGDPLLCVYAPGDSRSVIAVLPGGDVKTLLWIADKKRWEARFDVPTYAASGAYEVAVHITAADGTRTQRVFRYDVDTTSPQATGQAAIANGNLEITVDADADAARVVAVLPWGERCILEAIPGVAGRFFARVPVPAGTNAVESVPVYITDRAHNRTEIKVAP